MNMIASYLPSVPAAGRFGARKVFISALWERLGRPGTLAGFKDELLAAARAGEIELARADLVAAMPAELVAASEIAATGATFHFVVDRSAREAWE